MLGDTLTELCYAHLPTSKAKLDLKSRNILREGKNFSCFSCSAGNGAPGTILLNSHYIPNYSFCCTVRKISSFPNSY